MSIPLGSLHSIRPASEGSFINLGVGRRKLGSFWRMWVLLRLSFSFKTSGQLHRYPSRGGRRSYAMEPAYHRPHVHNRCLVYALLHLEVGLASTEHPRGVQDCHLAHHRIFRLCCACWVHGHTQRATAPQLSGTVRGNHGERQCVCYGHIQRHLELQWVLQR